MSTKPRVLLVEDEPEIRRFVKSALESMHCVVSEADSVMSATHVLSVNPADLWCWIWVCPTRMVKP